MTKPAPRKYLEVTNKAHRLVKVHVAKSSEPCTVMEVASNIIVSALSPGNKRKAKASA